MHHVHFGQWVTNIRPIFIVFFTNVPNWRMDEVEDVDTRCGVSQPLWLTLGVIKIPQFLLALGDQCDVAAFLILLSFCF